MKGRIDGDHPAWCYLEAASPEALEPGGRMGGWENPGDLLLATGSFMLAHWCVGLGTCSTECGDFMEAKLLEAHAQGERQASGPRGPL